MLTQQIGRFGERIGRYQYLSVIPEQFDQKLIVIRVECLETTMPTSESLIRGADDEEYEQIGVEIASGGQRVSRRLPPPGA